MSDNVNKFGSNIQSVQDAYQGFSKQNFTMLDNLRLGYGGTKAEMERLIADANKVKAAHGEMADLSIDSFADITEAIHVVQTEMGITGTTAAEAATTISGSVASMRASWKNWLAGLADDEADVGALTDQLVDSAVIAAGNIIPRMGQIASSLGEALMAKGPEIASKLGGALLDALPQTLSQTFRSSVQLWDMGGTLEEKVRLTFGYLKAVVAQEFSGLLWLWGRRSRASRPRSRARWAPSRRSRVSPRSAASPPASPRSSCPRASPPGSSSRASPASPGRRASARRSRCSGRTSPRRAAPCRS